MYKRDLIPDGRDRHGETWTTLETIYLCGNWSFKEKDQRLKVSKQLGRTLGTCATKVRKLREQFLFNKLRSEWNNAR